jgi:AGZA family xanthine/uracil permease-like MFS transporter
MFGMVFAVIGPVATLTKDPVLAWKVGMAVTVLMGVVKVGTAFVGEWVRRSVPRAGLLGSIAGVALLLIAFLPALKVFGDPLVGLTALAILFVGLMGRVRLPGGVPTAFASLLAGTLVFYLGQWLGWGRGAAPALAFGTLRLAFPWPTWEFWDGMGLGLQYLPVAIPFALATVIGGIDVTESAAAAGDAYETRSILLTEGIATLVAGLCGGVLQSTPYIGHPAYKVMGGRAAYTLATAIVIGIGGMVGILSWVVHLIPEAAVAPILIFIGLEITAQAFVATPPRHAQAVAVAFLPVIANLLLIHSGQLLAQLGHPALPGEAARGLEIVRVLGNGFILSALLWGAGLAFIIDRRLRAAASVFALAALGSLFGLIHSPLELGGLFLPWWVNTRLPWLLGAGYGLVAAILGGLAGRAGEREED